MINDKFKEILINKQLKAKHRAEKLKNFKNPSSSIYLLLKSLEKAKKGIL